MAKVGHRLTNYTSLSKCREYVREVIRKSGLKAEVVRHTVGVSGRCVKFAVVRPLETASPDAMRYDESQVVPV